jgi:hypothetical protein
MNKLAELCGFLQYILPHIIHSILCWGVIPHPIAVMVCIELKEITGSSPPVFPSGFEGYPYVVPVGLLVKGKAYIPVDT